MSIAGLIGGIAPESTIEYGGLILGGTELQEMLKR